MTLCSSSSHVLISSVMTPFIRGSKDGINMIESGVELSHIVDLCIVSVGISISVSVSFSTKPGPAALRKATLRVQVCYTSCTGH